MEESDALQNNASTGGHIMRRPIKESWSSVVQPTKIQMSPLQKTSKTDNPFNRIDPKHIFTKSFVENYIQSENHAAKQINLKSRSSAVSQRQQPKTRHRKTIKSRRHSI
jgi:hypothetical protein